VEDGGRIRQATGGGARIALGRARNPGRLGADLAVPLIPLIVLVAIVCALVIAWLLELLGALIFIAAAVLAFMQWEQPHWFSLTTICLPMLIAGVLLIIAWAIARFGGSAQIPTIAPPDEKTEDEGRWDDRGW
jgi:hypothetical protein